MFKCKDCGTEINEGEYKTFGVCDNCWDKASLQNLPKADANSLLAEVRALQERIEKIEKDIEYLKNKDYSDPLNRILG